MGKVPIPSPTPPPAMKRKKKGRPSKAPSPSPSPPKPPITNSSSRRSTRLNPSHFNSSPQQDSDDDDDERREKKVKLVVRLPQSDDTVKPERHSRDSDSDYGSGSGSDRESEDRDRCAKKRKTNGGDRGSDDGDSAQDKEDRKAMNTPLNGSQLESGPTTPLPEKTLLVFILDRLQKKDTYGVFSEPVDPSELPDYFDVIERPMDFGTVRKQLNTGAYKCLEELEADVFLICSNAMQYNSSDTVYYRQARSIQELAKRDFENLKHEGANGEPQPRIVRRGRPPGNKNQKKLLEASTVDIVDRVGTEASSGATLASEEDKAPGSNSYNLRKGPALLKSRITEPFVSTQRSRNGENYSEWSADWNNEFPASILRADMKHGKKNLTVDENKRDTYRQSMSLPNNSIGLPGSVGNMKRLVPVGLQEALAYARSLARYAANLGPVAWKIASRKIEAVLPPGVEYGPGWVGDNGVATSQPPEKPTSSNITTPPASSDLTSTVANRPSGIIEAGKKLDNLKEVSRPHFPAQQNPVHQPYRNGFTGTSHGIPEQAGKVSDLVTEQRRHNGLVPPDLNVRVSGGSPSSSLQIGSPRQPDLALQL